MVDNIRDEPRPSNDSRRRRTSVESEQVETVVPERGFAQKWQNLQPTKTVLVWACLASIVLTIVVGFAWGGWVTTGRSLAAGVVVGEDAVTQRLAPICVTQFNQDPDKEQKLVELGEMTSYRRAQYVQDQGWATMPGEEGPDRSVADACAKLLMADQ